MEPERKLLIVTFADSAHYNELGLHKASPDDAVLNKTAFAFTPDHLTNVAEYVTKAETLSAILVFVFCGDVLTSQADRDMIDNATNAARATGGAGILVLGNHETEVFDALRTDNDFFAARTWADHADKVMTVKEAEAFSETYIELFPCDLKPTSPVIIGCLNVVLGDANNVLLVARSLVDQIRGGKPPYHAAFVTDGDEVLERTLAASRGATARRECRFYEDYETVVWATHFPPTGDAATYATQCELQLENPNLILYGHDHSKAGITYTPVEGRSATDFSPELWFSTGRPLNGYATNCAVYDDTGLRGTVGRSKNMRRGDFTNMDADTFAGCLGATKPVRAWIIDSAAKVALYGSFFDPRCYAYHQRAAARCDLPEPFRGWSDWTEAHGFW